MTINTDYSTKDVKLFSSYHSHRHLLSNPSNLLYSTHAINHSHQMKQNRPHQWPTNWNIFTVLTQNKWLSNPVMATLYMATGSIFQLHLPTWHRNHHPTVLHGPQESTSPNRTAIHSAAFAVCMWQTDTMETAGTIVCTSCIQCGLTMEESSAAKIHPVS